jgi:hypothetical protein
MTTKVTGSVLANTAVTAGTYGGSLAIPVVTVDAQGRLTSAANVSVTQTSVYANTGQLTANAATGVVAVGLATSGAIAGSYGSGTQTPVLTIDAYGRVTSVSATTITGGSAGIGATTYNRQSNTATAGQTVFTVSGGYTVGYLQVYHNGVLLNASDYTATNGTSFTLAVAATLGDIVESLAYTVTNVLNVSPSPSGGSAGQVLYQSAANTTANTDVGTAGYLLTSQGTGKPTWSAQTSLVIANTQITGVITAAQHANTSVTPGTYGGAAAIPVIVVDQQGRLTSAANVAFSASVPVDVQTFNSTGTWTKPTGGQTMARIQIWGGGGGGSRNSSASGNGGGGGGAYIELTVPISYLGATVTATVGNGGSGATGTGSGGVGGSSSITLSTAFQNTTTFTAYGGGGGYQLGNAGGGGGLAGAGQSGSSGGSSSFGGAGYTGQTGSGVFGPCGASYTVYFNAIDAGGYGAAIGPASGSQFGGGGGGGRPDQSWGAGGSSLWGGGGGALAGYAGGVSIYGGNGGSNSVGTAPAGGGGASTSANVNGSNGAAGRIVITSY